MPDALVARLESILSNLGPARASEEATKQHIVLPVLHELGWNVFNTAEVVPEDATDENKRVDYALTLQGKRRVFIEAKRADKKLEPFQKQLLTYAFERGVELAVLTSGVEWWFYLPLRPGDWQQRRFLMLDLEKAGPHKAADELASFLTRSAVTSGEAVERAQHVFDSATRRRAVRRALPVVWAAMQAKPDDELVTLIQQRVETHCGHLPTADEVAELLGATPASTPRDVSPSRPAKPALAPAVMPASGKVMPLKQLVNGHPVTFVKPQALVFDGQHIAVRNWAELAVAFVGHLVERNELRREHLPICNHAGTKRYFVNREPEHADPKRGGSWKPVGDFHVDTRHSAESIVANLAATLDRLGLDAERVAVELKRSAA